GRAEDTDWPQILVLCELLERLPPSPVVTLNHAVALAMVRGPRAGLDLLSTLDGDPRLAGHHRLDAGPAHLLGPARPPPPPPGALPAAPPRHHQPARATLPGGPGGPPGALSRPG